MKTNCEHVWDKGAENTLVDTSAEESPHMMLFCPHGIRLFGGVVYHKKMFREMLTPQWQEIWDAEDAKLLL